MKRKQIRQTRIIYKVTDKNDGRYYIGKCCLPSNMSKDIKYYTICPSMKKMSEEWFKTDIDNLEFELLEYDIEHIDMEDVLEKYLKDEMNPNKLVYYKQREYVEDNLKRSDRYDCNNV